MRRQKAYWMSSDTSRRSNKAECLRDFSLWAMVMFTGGTSRLLLQYVEMYLYSFTGS
ncbi:putative membrane protein [Paenibacillus riograndensis SBR5]|uniref:Putative membrane protein n=1 Tax=Paenibacillus riograndensis SBR5 TaxID=1073571 RepID=A0A0E4HBW8_9BACL|nr:putative membrane protein [Paenibacillus riograndensis SBR5]